MKASRSIIGLCPAEKSCARVLKFVLTSGCSAKEDSDTYLQYLHKKNFSNTKLKKQYYFTSREIERIGYENFSSETCNDVTLLYKLIRVCCDDIADPNMDIWTQTTDRYPDILECLLKAIRNIRDELAHDDISQSEKELGNHLTVMCTKIILSAAEKYTVAPKKVESEINYIMRCLCFETEHDLYIRDNCKKIIRDARKEICSKLINFFGELPTFLRRRTVNEFNLNSVFHDISVIPNDNVSHSDDTASSESTLNYRKLLTPWPGEEETKPIVIVQGMCGTGKSTLIKRAMQEFCSDIVDCILDIKSFDFVIYFACKDPTIKSLESLVYRYYSSTLLHHYVLTYEDILSRNVLYLVDGIDEQVKESSTVMCDILIRLANGQGRMLCTTRPHNLHNVIQHFNKSNCEFNLCTLPGILGKDQQKSFLMKYADQMGLRVFRENDGDSFTLECFDKCQVKFPSYFIYPLNIVLFAYMSFYSNVEEVQWNNEINIYQKSIQYYKYLIRDRMDDRGSTPNLDLKIERVMESIYQHALTTVHENQYVMSSHHYRLLREKIFEIDHDLQVDDILGVFLTPVLEFRSVDGKYYQYLHKVIQDYFASMALLSLIEHEANVDKSVEEILSQFLGERPDSKS